MLCCIINIFLFCSFFSIGIIYRYCCNEQSKSRGTNKIVYSLVKWVRFLCLFVFDHIIKLTICKLLFFFIQSPFSLFCFFVFLLLPLHMFFFLFYYQIMLCVGFHCFYADKCICSSQFIVCVYCNNINICTINEDNVFE